MNDGIRDGGRGGGDRVARVRAMCLQLLALVNEEEV